jgi:hypothetical protein
MSDLAEHSLHLCCKIGATEVKASTTAVVLRDAELHLSKNTGNGLRLLASCSAGGNLLPNSVLIRVTQS